jgi:hypothetical protein
VIVRRAVGWAVGLWLTFAFVVWNVVFDRMLVLAGRRYSYDAYVLFHSTGRYLKIDDVMRPAVAHAFTVASLTASGIVVVSLTLIRIAATHDRRRSGHGVTPVFPSARSPGCRAPYIPDADGQSSDRDR